jgi:plasmid maintenance system killer protein
MSRSAALKTALTVRLAIKVSGNWRWAFELKDGDALNVAIEDCH